MTACNCTLHRSRKGHADPCRACQSKHVSIRLAPAARNGGIPVPPTGQPEAPQFARTTDAAVGASPSRSRSVPSGTSDSLGSGRRRANPSGATPAPESAGTL